MIPPAETVACGACRRCCIGEQIVLHPEGGDILAAFPERVLSRHGLTGAMVYVIPHKPGTNECVHLTDDGCEIHDRAPVICRAFSCVKFYLGTPRAERRRRERAMPGIRALYDRARELLMDAPE